jgi:tRNA(Ile)-lysidine synthase
MKHVLAISGGVDSVVLLDMFANGGLPSTFHPEGLKGAVVAHFDHGIRAESGVDAELVKKLAAKYQMKFALGQGKLGKNASEQSARQARYKFLRKICYKDRPCSKRDVKIITAHHQDDLIETILMNLIRGTGWRGLAPMWSSDIVRPLLKYSKAELVAYAIKNKLEWAEDETNYSPKYFRNRLRNLVAKMSPEQRRKLLKLNQKQTKLRTEIENILEHKNPHSKNGSWSDQDDNDSHYRISTGELPVNNLLILPDDVGLEVLRKITQQRLTTPQLKRLWGKLKTAKSGDLLEPGGGLRIGVYQGQITVSQLG